MFCFGRGEPPSRSLERGSVNQGPFPSGILHRWITAPSVNLTLYTPIRRVHDNNFSGKSRQTAASPVRFEIPRVGSRDSLITIDEDDPLSSMIFFLQVTFFKNNICNMCFIIILAFYELISIYLFYLFTLFTWYKWRKKKEEWERIFERKLSFVIIHFLYPFLYLKFLYRDSCEEYVFSFFSFFFLFLFD